MTNRTGRRPSEQKATTAASHQLPTALHGIGYDVNSVFFAFYGLILGYLIFRSTFLPRVIAVLLAIGAACYLAY